MRSWEYAGKASILRFKFGENVAQGLDDFLTFHVALPELHYQLKFFGGGHKAENGVVRLLVRVAFLARLLAIDQTQGKTPDEVAHFGFTRRARHLQQLGFGEHAALYSQRLDFIRNGTQTERFRD